jgi:hypothetical protein
MADPEAAARLRLIVALDEVHAAAKALGMDVAAIGELYAPLPMRVDACIGRTHREANRWDRLRRAPLFHAARMRRPEA